MRTISWLCSALLTFTAVRGSIVEYKTAVTNESSLISYYTFDAGDAKDSKSSNDGTLIGTTSFVSGIGKGADQALLLKGAGQVNLGQVDAFDFSSGVGTIEAWIRADWNTIGYNPAIFADRDDGPVNWSIHMNATKDALGLWNGSSYEGRVLPGGLAGVAWHHLAVVFDVDPDTLAPSFSVYWDGILAGTTAQGLGVAPESPTELGSSSVAGKEQWNGALDEIAFYSDALSAETIKAHYTAFLVGDPPSIQTQPQGGTFLNGVSLTLTVEAKGAGLSYQWFKNDTKIANATNSTLVFASLTANDAAAYKAMVSNAAGSQTSTAAEIKLGELSAKLQRYQTAVRAESSLISYYTFDSVNADDSKDGNNGTPVGRVQFGDGIGGGGAKALVLDGSGHVNLGVVDAFDFSAGTGTVEAWIRADWISTPGYNPAVFADRDGTPVNWSIHMNSGKDALGLWNGSTYIPALTPGTGTSWHHLAVVFDNSTGDSTFTVFWDGDLAGTALQGLGPNPEAPTELGSSAPGGQERWIGGLDEVAFYSDALSAESVHAHYAAFAQGDPPVLTAQPHGGSFFEGVPVTLTVGAQGLDLTYQWFKNGLAIQDATSANLTFDAFSASDAATYRVKVSNADGDVISTDAVLLLIVPDLPKYQNAVRAEASLISYYTFDAGDVADSKASNDGTPIDSISFGSGVGGGNDQALLLDGTGHVDLGNVEAFNFSSGQGTVEAWVPADWDSSPGYNPAIFADRDNGPVNWSIHLEAGKGAGGLWNGSAYQPIPLLNTGISWHHLAVVFSTNNLGNPTFTLYWDGSLAGTTPQGLGAAPESPTELGSSSLIGTERWVGALDEVAFYSTALNSDAIQNHFRALAGGLPQSPALALARSGTQVTISWPVAISGFTLEFANTLPAASWSPVPGVIGNSVAVDSSTGTRFYRLRGN